MATVSISATSNTHIIETTSSKIRSFLYELAEGTSNYRSLHSLTEQVEHQYHGRFVVELIQNAHDALLANTHDVSDPSRIEIVFSPHEGPFGTMYVANDGRPFSPSNFTSISQLGQSDKDPQESIGNKGIGFRSVLEITDEPEIYSRCDLNSASFDGFCFAFSPTVIQRLATPVIALLQGDNYARSPFSDHPLVDWDTRLLDKYRSTVLPQGEQWLLHELKYLSPYLLPFPIPPENRPNQVQDFEQRGFATVIRFPVKSTVAANLIQTQLEKLDAGTMLFLDKAGSLVLDNGTTRRTLSRLSSPLDHSVLNGRKVVIRESDHDEERRYWTWSQTISIADAPDDFQQAVQQLPGKWPDLREACVSISVRLDDKHEPGLLSIFLPTLLATGYAAHINAPFFADMSRTHIDFQNEYNRHLLNYAALLAIDVIIHDLAGNGEAAARAIIDLIAPISEEREITDRWRQYTCDAAMDAGCPIVESPWILSEYGWHSLGAIYQMPSCKSSLVINETLFRKHASFYIIHPSLNSRSSQINALAQHYINTGIDPLPTLIADTLEAVAVHFHDHDQQFDWNGFWADADMLLSGDSSPLADRRVLLGTDRQLHSPGDTCAVFFIPRQGSLDDEEVENEGAIIDIPVTLQKFVAFLSEDIRVYDENDARAQTRIRKFLDKTLVNRFRVDDIFREVLIPRTPRLPIPLNSSKSSLCRDILLWGLRLMSNLTERGRGSRSLRYLADLPVPCIGGWYRLGEACFGEGWRDTLGNDLISYLDGINSHESVDAMKRILLPPSDKRWRRNGRAYQGLLEQAGVFNGLRLLSVSQQAWKSGFDACGDNFRLPPGAPSGFPATIWEDYRVYAQATAKLLYSGWFSYRVQPLTTIPGFDRYDDFDEQKRLAFMELVLGSMARWDKDWEQLKVHKTYGLDDKITLEESPLFFALKRISWIGQDESTNQKPQGDPKRWCRPSEHWHVPAAALAGRAWQFGHLNPLNAAISYRLDINPELANVLQRLGLPRFDPETPSDNARLIEDLINAVTQRDIPDPNVFLGQVRSAWKAFYPQASSPFPTQLLVSRAGGQLCAENPTMMNPVYLPDSSKSFAHLEQFDLPVVAIETSDAARLADRFVSAYGTAVIRISTLRVVPLVNGEEWHAADHAVSMEHLRDNELEWLIPAILTLAAFYGPQSRGTASKRFRDQMASFREVRFVWVSSLEVGLFRDDKVVVKPHVPALWLSDDHILMIDDECKLEDPSLLSEALAHIVDRDELEVPIKLLLGITGLEPEYKDILRALAQLRLTEQQFCDVREHWRGDLGQIIQMLIPLLSILNPTIDTGDLVALDTDESVIVYINMLNDPRLDGSALVNDARNCASMHSFGLCSFHKFGIEVQLSAWNAALVRFNIPPIKNADAKSDFNMHHSTMMQPLRSLLSVIISRHDDIGTFVELLGQLEPLTCPEHYEHEKWEVTFNDTISVCVPLFEQWRASTAEIEILQQATSSTYLVEALSHTGIDISVDPMDLFRDNRERLQSAIGQLQEIGLAWALDTNAPNPADWESRVDSYLAYLSEALDSEGYLKQWSEYEIFSLLKTLPADQSSTAFWECLAISSDFKDFMDRLPISMERLLDASSRLHALKEEARRRKKLIDVCGMEFDGSEDNLDGLWAHICVGISTMDLETFPPINVAQPVDLLQVQTTRKSSSRDGQIKKGATPRRLTKSMESLIGLCGEIHSFRLLQQTYGSTAVSASSWISRNSIYVFPAESRLTDDNYGCDFRFCLNGRNYFVEVKASDGDDDCFTLGSSEIRLAMEVAKAKRRRQRDIFVILRVTRALSKYPVYQVLPNPYDTRYQSLYAIEEADARVRYKVPNA